MTPAEILRAAAARIIVPGQWTQGDLARARNGCRVDPHSPEARCWCMRGAIIAESPFLLDLPAAVQAAISAAVLFVGDTLAVYNDEPGRTAQEVHDALLRAADLCH